MEVSRGGNEIKPKDPKHLILQNVFRPGQWWKNAAISKQSLRGSIIRHL